MITLIILSIVSMALMVALIISLILISIGGAFFVIIFADVAIALLALWLICKSIKKRKK